MRLYITYLNEGRTYSQGECDLSTLRITGDSISITSERKWLYYILEPSASPSPDTLHKIIVDAAHYKRDLIFTVFRPAQWETEWFLLGISSLDKGGYYVPHHPSHERLAGQRQNNLRPTASCLNSNPPRHLPCLFAQMGQVRCLFPCALQH